jgi:RNA polymerase sigma-70 factor (ECF subfamily)
LRRTESHSPVTHLLDRLCGKLPSMELAKKVEIMAVGCALERRNMIVPGSSKWVAQQECFLAAMDEVFAAHRAGLIRLVAGVVQNREAAEDIVQSTFTKAAQAGNVPPEAMKSWLYRVAFHEAITWKRRCGVDRRATQAMWEQRSSEDSEGPETPLVRQEVIQQVREAMNELPRRQREVVLARMEGDKTFAQIATQMGLPLGTVLTHMRRALETLRQKLHEND